MAYWTLSMVQSEAEFQNNKRLKKKGGAGRNRTDSIRPVQGASVPISALPLSLIECTQ